MNPISLVLGALRFSKPGILAVRGRFQAYCKNNESALGFHPCVEYRWYEIVIPGGPGQGGAEGARDKKPMLNRLLNGRRTNSCGRHGTARPH